MRWSLEPLSGRALGASLRDLYETVDMPLEGERELQEAWRLLGEVRSFDAGVLAAIRVVLARTQPHPDSPLVPLEVPRAAPLPRATAAHPRAFRGTVRQPPKPPQAESVDLRPVLASAAGTRQLQRHLHLAPLPHWEVPPLFERTLLPLVGEQVRAWLALFWALGLDRRGSLLQAVCQLASWDSGPNGQAWCGLLVGLRPRQRAIFLTCLLESGGWKAPAPQHLEPFPRVAAGLVAVRAYWFGCCLRRGAAPGHLLAALDYVEPQQSLPVLGAVGAFEAEDLRRVAEHVGGWWSSLWQRPELLREPFWLDLPRDDVWLAVRCLTDQPRWSLSRLLAGIPREYWCKAMEFLDAAPPDLDPAAAALLVRLCRAPLRREVSGWCLKLWGHLAAQEGWRERLMRLPDASWRAMEKQGYRDAQAFLATQGVGRLAHWLPDLAMALWEHFPAALLGSSGRIASLHPHLLRRVLEEWRAHPLVREAELEKVPALLEEHLPRLAPHRLPPRLRRGQARPSDWERLRDRLPLCRYDLLVELSERALLADLGLTGTGEAALHAAQMAASLHENRRQLRNYLRAYGRGHSPPHPANLVTPSPANRAWLAAHPGFPLDSWLGGWEMTVEEVPGAPLRLAIEQDPLEVLRMGTHVGSCLSLGGGLEHSAAAVLLDVNKQVVFARDCRGRVVGRQLLAISAAHELVPFSVYPEDAPLWMQSLFREYDAELAVRLGLPLCKTHDHEVELLVAQNWWDDGAWLPGG